MENKIERKQQDTLWDILKEHRGHHVEIAVYGDWDSPVSITLEDMDTNEIILDAGLYTLIDREDAVYE